MISVGKEKGEQIGGICRIRDKKDVKSTKKRGSEREREREIEREREREEEREREG
jgi:hypothetical protein